jgi:hypothetical protein
MDKTIENLCGFQKDMWYWAFCIMQTCIKPLHHSHFLEYPQTNPQTFFYNQQQLMPQHYTHYTHLFCGTSNL